jgi:hypothetical protein
MNFGERRRPGFRRPGVPPVHCHRKAMNAADQPFPATRGQGPHSDAGPASHPAKLEIGGNWGQSPISGEIGDSHLFLGGNWGNWGQSPISEIGDSHQLKTEKVSGTFSLAGGAVGVFEGRMAFRCAAEHCTAMPR